MNGNNTKAYKEYFKKFAKQWVLDAYHNEGYNMPLPYHRARIVSRFISKLSRKRLKILDLGCGGGDVTFLLAQQGHEVVGVDQSKPMIELAEARRLKMPKAVQQRTSFMLGTVEQILLKEKFDVVVAMGLIGYLESDADLFRAAKAMLKKGGHLLVSCRNRLFNMNSLTFRTKNEIKKGTAIELIEEIESLYERVPAKDADVFIGNLKRITKELPIRTSYDRQAMLSPSERRALAKTPPLEPRQQRPKELITTGKNHGFAHVVYFGVSPHLMDPNLNKMLPPQIFNAISRSLEAFEHLPISLAWSSVFIGAFKKR